MKPYLIVLSVTYAAIAFVTGEVNPLAWTQDNKYAYLVLNIWGGFLGWLWGRT